jgi:penicillin-insensitive murein endopeptidase
VHSERNRFFGHPKLIALVRELGHRMAKLKRTPLIVGDLAQARGGPAPTGHASHQNGLDVDIWFAQPNGTRGPSMVDDQHQRPSPLFTKTRAALLELAASDPRVDRVFVNPVLKRALCKSAGEKREWLRRLRPWWGHDDHFHVRLACPPDSPDCKAQPPLPPGDGCNELAWWFRAAAKRDQRPTSPPSPPTAPKAATGPQLPDRCRELLQP